MQKTYVTDFPQMPRVAQENSYYCGPASVQMLAAFWGKEITQKEIVAAVATEKHIEKYGLTVDQLGEAAKKLLPELTFWSKCDASLSELSRLINEYKVPVGVEWQGIFDYPDEEVADDEDDDPGHISVITHLDTRDNVVRIADPDIHYAGKDRVFKVIQFDYRWWDITVYKNGLTGKMEQKDEYHAMFVLLPKNLIYPEQLGMQQS